MAATSSACPFFDKLPAELRLEIYELSFKPASTEDEVDLCAVNPPSKSLLLTCGKAYNEAQAIFKQAHRQHWSSSNFTMSLSGPASQKKENRKHALLALAALRGEDLQHIVHLTIIREELSTGEEGTNMKLLDRRGSWKCTWLYDGGTEDNLYFVLKPGVPYSDWRDFEVEEMVEWHANNWETESMPVKQQITKVIQVLF
ncbi:hypothetical protein CLAFUR4_12240 [Fulvia fulva]|nr:hypothetical protein CLAFUR4_12240 [Fulvia fulva]